MIRTQIQLHPEQIRWLKKYALEKGISMSQVIREGIDSYRSYIEYVKKRNAKKKRALKAVGSFTTNTEKT